MSVVTVERLKLYEQVWSMPGQQLALLYGISDVGLAKACKRYDIPRPPRGYWARLAAGQRMKKPRLPQPQLGDELVYLKGWDMPDESVQKLVEANRMAPTSETTAISGEVHPLGTATREQLRAAKPDHDGLVHANAPALDVRVSPGLVERAGAVMDALIKRWEARGGTVAADDGDHQGTRFAIGPDSFGVKLVENLDQSKPVSDPTRRTGYLSLNITSTRDQQFRQRWSDTKTQRLERMLSAFVETLANALAVIRQNRLDAECVERQEEKVDAVRGAAQHGASREFYFRQELMKTVDRWHDAQRIRGFLSALDAAVKAERWHPKDEKQFAAWFQWAVQFADSVDPVTAGPRPEGKPPERQNTAIAELDLTAATKATIEKLGVADTHALSQQSKEAVRDARQGKLGPIWNEITRVLESLYYDVSKRERGSDWW